MLYMIYHKHSAEMCPGGTVRPDKGFVMKLSKQIEESGVNLVEGYVDAPGHEFYFILETEDLSKLNTAIEQLRLVGHTNRIAPVMRFSDAVQWAKKMGLQE